MLIETVYIYTDVCIYIHTHTGASGRAGGRGSGGDRAPRGSAVLADAGVLQWAWGSTAFRSKDVARVAVDACQKRDAIH